MSFREMVAMCVGVLMVGAGAVSARQAAGPDFSKGVFYGQVVDAGTGKPVPDATVAVEEKPGKAIAWTKTDARGRYAIAADMLKTLRLQPSRHRGLLMAMLNGAGKVVTAPVKLAGDALHTGAGIVKQTIVMGIGSVGPAALSAATANPVPLAAHLGGAAARTAAGPVAAREQAQAKQVLSPRELLATQKTEKSGELLPGEVYLHVSATGYKELQGKADAYWIAAPTTVENRAVGPQGWLEPAKLAPATSDKSSEVQDVALLLTDPAIDPDMATPGTPIKLTVKLQTPPEPPAEIRVFARERGNVAELKPDEKDRSLYSGVLTLDPKEPAGPATITLVALHAEPVEVRLKGKGDALVHFVQRLDDLEPDHPYDFDPRIMASENRLELPLTVLDTKKATPVGAAPPPAGADK